MKLLFASLALTLLLLAGCSGSGKQGGNVLTVAATAVPHAEILKQAKPLLAKEGVELQVKVFADYVQPNTQVAEKNIDLNYFQTKPYLDAFNRERGTRLTIVTGVHIEPFGAYSRKFKSIDQLPDGASVTLPNDPSNSGRALLLLAKHGLITLKDPTDEMATLKDVTANPKHLKFRELEAAMLPRTLDEVDLALINTNYALAAGLNPTKDALLIEGKDSPYVNYLVGRPDNQDDPRVQKLARVLNSPQIKAFIEQKYHGAVLPAF
ncbi:MULTISPECIES: MetQ/NlpA family ABC transporter substrate-binding protein [Rhodanobacter]|uniref:ABC-type metal ion transport system, periplasmic component/surface antigen n=1 Tax=Rhodanobacter denitrificans TaxID=666685 RepID=M4NQ63_9GAMM|nr:MULTISPECIES: MetQ/NlpA family ABC transporter substrate-binding protein [Rhodanobacter]AGG89756.1 ABC-type metal ion transport system, periplasmic component/surface antigen [Rhodanobacter denitrificans]KZC21759.1 methionine ABC transporter substrate-binding protein [Rhodanobacter denitrificans]UJJ49949.1 MetQ/NlpA family ABC transporter substrate-binding protein [Rhodanobacter denitrificans]UJM85154.1 MetQ/NlpA family ABC transporter substrate-binding protein [Rhodanobacter denitrificans]U